MFKIAMKHYIWETCIEALFKPLIDTFQPRPLVPLKNIKVAKGDLFREIHIPIWNDVYYECWVDEVWMGSKELMVDFTFNRLTNPHVKAVHVSIYMKYAEFYK